MTDLPANPLDLQKLNCIDCGGWPIDNGAVFVAVFKVQDGVPQLGGMCELCWLKRLQKRGQIVNMTSTRGSQVEVPELGLFKDRTHR